MNTRDRYRQEQRWKKEAVLVYSEVVHKDDYGNEIRRVIVVDHDGMGGYREHVSEHRDLEDMNEFYHPETGRVWRKAHKGLTPISRDDANKLFTERKAR